MENSSPMSLAHKLYKTGNYPSFSAALKAAWSKTKGVQTPAVEATTVLGGLAIKEVFIPMANDNLIKIMRGSKATTVRTLKAAAKIGLSVGEVGYFATASGIFLVQNYGLKSVHELKGEIQARRFEGLKPHEQTKYPSTQHWLSGVGGLVVFGVAYVGYADLTQITRSGATKLITERVNALKLSDLWG